MHVLASVIGILESVKSSYGMLCMWSGRQAHVVLTGRSGLLRKTGVRGYGSAAAGEGRRCYRLPEGIDKRGHPQGAPYTYARTRYWSKTTGMPRAWLAARS